MQTNTGLIRTAGWLGLTLLASWIILAPNSWADDQTPYPTALRIAAMGDVMMGTENLLPPDGGAGLFSKVKPFLKKADLVFCNYEGTLTDQGTPTKTSASGMSYCFRTPPDYGKHLRAAGFNMVSIANNHINDYGEEGKAQTILTLELNGIAWSGPTGTVASRSFNGLRVVLVAFHSSSHSNHLLDIPGAKALVKELDQKNDIVVVSFHGGAEGASATRIPKGPETFCGEERGDVHCFAHAVVDSGADLVIGHGPHVPRAMEIYRQRLIAYSLGNFCTMKGIKVKGPNGLAPLLLVDLDREGRLVGGHIVSFIQSMGVPPKPDPSNKAAKLIHRLGEQDFPGHNPVDSSGRIKAPPKPVSGPKDTN